MSRYGNAMWPDINPIYFYIIVCACVGRTDSQCAVTNLDWVPVTSGQELGSRSSCCHSRPRSHHSTENIYTPSWKLRRTNLHDSRSEDFIPIIQQINQQRQDTSNPRQSLWASKMRGHKAVTIVLGILLTSVKYCVGEAVLGDICKYGILRNGHR